MSILVARRVPFERALGDAGLRLVAASSLAIVGLILLGAPIGHAGAWGLLALSTGVAFVVDRYARKSRSARGGERA